MKADDKYSVDAIAAAFGMDEGCPTQHIVRYLTDQILLQYAVPLRFFWISGTFPPPSAAELEWIRAWTRYAGMPDD